MYFLSKELDNIYDTIDYLMKENNIEELDKLLKNSYYYCHDVDLLLGYLTASLPMKSKLQSRKLIIKKLETLSNFDRKLLVGLE